MSSIAQYVKLQLRTKVSDESIRSRLPAQVEEDEFDVVVRGQTVVYKPNGDPLFILVKQAFSEELERNAWPAFTEIGKMTTDNRAAYAGAKTSKALGGGNSNRAITEEGKRFWVRSSVVGYFDRQGGRHPYCRTTAFTANNVEMWETIVPIVQHAAELFKDTLPKYFERQMEAAQKCDPHWIIRGTPFSTLTVNTNTRAGIHKDAGDFKDGFGLLAVFKRGSFKGALLGFPQYRVAVDIGHRDLLFFNPHEWHANTPYIEQSEDAERVSLVFYLRERMMHCGTPEQEIKNARKVRGSL